MTGVTPFLAKLVFDRGDGWVSIQVHTFRASHPEIAYQLALARGRSARGDQRFIGLSELIASEGQPSGWGEMVRVDPKSLVKEKLSLGAFRDPRWEGLPWDERELDAALQAPLIPHRPRGLGTVDWGHLTHAYGSARDVPTYLERLGAVDPGVRQEAFQALLMSILHQGSLYTATVATIPFLLRLVEDPLHPARLEAMDLVRMITEECCFEFYDRRRATLREGEEAEARSERQPGDDLDLVGSIRDMLLADMDLLKQLESDEDPYIVEMVKFVLSEAVGGRDTE